VRKTGPFAFAFFSIAAAFLAVQDQGAAQDKGKEAQPFRPAALESFKGKVKLDGVTVAVQAFDRDEEAATAFGKVSPYRFGVLPVLVIIRNDRPQALKLDGMRLEYHWGRNRIEATPAADVAYLVGPDKPKLPSTRPIPLPRRKKKNPLAAFEIEGRAFAAKMLGPGEEAHGFFYFQTQNRVDSKLYLTGIVEAGTNKELFYFEIPFED